MARPLPAPNKLRGGTNGPGSTRPAGAGVVQEAPAASATPEQLQELAQLRDENGQLRALCLELEQALHEATQAASAHGEDRAKDYEAVLEEKTEVIRQLHEQIEKMQSSQAEHESQAAAKPTNSGPAPREDELLSLSEDLERERRQLQEDEQALMQQMREMEVSMAKERAEMARQRNDMQRVQSEIRHELERLERSGALQSKIDGLKSKLQDVCTRRGSAPAAAFSQGAPSPGAVPGSPAPARKDSIFGRIFGGGK
jgi:chromosome segregation ATPase